MYSELQTVRSSKSNCLAVVSSVLYRSGARDVKTMNTIVSVPRELRDLERPVVRQIVSVACGVEREGIPQSVATQTRREFAVESPPSSSGELESAVVEELMETGGSVVEAVVGVFKRPGAADSVTVSSVQVVGSSPVGNAVDSTSRLVRSGKLNSFNDHVIHRNSDMLSLPSY